MRRDSESNSSLSVSVNGVRNNANNWTIDGVPNLDVFNSNNAIIPNVDALAEFRIDRGAYTADQGRSAGATVNAILKNGANDWHGSAFEFVRTAQPECQPVLQQVQRRRTSVGPLQQLWLYGVRTGHQGQAVLPVVAGVPPDRRADVHGPNRVPTDQEKNNGDFSDAESIGMSYPLVTTALAANPLCLGCVAGERFPNDTIPAALISKNAQLLLQTYYPSAGTYKNGVNYSSSAATVLTEREELIRMDYNLSDKWKMFAHYIQDQNHISSPYGQWGENALPNVGASTEFEPMQSFANQRHGNAFSEPGQQSAVRHLPQHHPHPTSPLLNRDRADGLDIPYYFPDHVDPQNRIPQLSMTHYAGITTTWPFLNGFFYHKWTDDLSWHRGNHDFRFGVLVTQQGKNENNAPNNLNGTFSWSGTAFDGVHTGNDMSDMLSNFADSYSESMNNPMQHLRYWDDEAYCAGTKWHISHRMSMTLGLRYSYFGPEIDQNNLLTNFLPQLYSAGLAPTVDAGTGNLTNIPISQMLSNGVYMPTNGIIAAGVNSPWGKCRVQHKKVEPGASLWNQL